MYSLSRMWSLPCCIEHPAKAVCWLVHGGQWCFRAFCNTPNCVSAGNKTRPLLLTASTSLPQVFLQSSLPVIQHYEALGKVHRIYADRSPDEVYQEVRELFL